MKSTHSQQQFEHTMHIMPVVPSVIWSLAMTGTIFNLFVIITKTIIIFATGAKEKMEKRWQREVQQLGRSSCSKFLHPPPLYILLH